MAWNPEKTDPSLTIGPDGVSIKKASNFGTHAKALGPAPIGKDIPFFTIVPSGIGDQAVGLATSSEPINSDLLGARANTSVGLWYNGWYQDDGGNWRRVPNFNAWLPGQTVRVSLDPATHMARWHLGEMLLLERSVGFAEPVYPAISLRYAEDNVVASFSEWAWVKPPDPPKPPDAEAGVSWWLIKGDDPEFIPEQLSRSKLVDGPVFYWEHSDLGALDPGASTAWRKLVLTGSKIGPWSHLHLSVQPSFGVAAPDAVYHADVLGRVAEEVVYRITNLGPAPLNTGLCKFWLKLL